MPPSNVGLRLRVALGALAVLLPAAAVASQPLAASAGPAGFTRNVSAAGTSVMAPAAAGSDAIQFPEIAGVSGDPGAAPFNGTITDRSQSSGRDGRGDGGDNHHRTPAASVVTSFDGITHRQQRLAGNGNQFSLEPP